MKQRRTHDRVVLYVFFCVSNLFDMLFFSLDYRQPNCYFCCLNLVIACKSSISIMFFSFVAIHVVRIRKLKIDTLDNKQHRKRFMEWLWFPLRFIAHQIPFNWMANKSIQWICIRLYLFDLFSVCFVFFSNRLNVRLRWMAHRCELAAVACAASLCLTLVISGVYFH